MNVDISSKQILIDDITECRKRNTGEKVLIEDLTQLSVQTLCYPTVFGFLVGRSLFNKSKFVSAE